MDAYISLIIKVINAYDTTSGARTDYEISVDSQMNHFHIDPDAPYSISNKKRVFHQQERGMKAIETNKEKSMNFRAH